MEKDFLKNLAKEFCEAEGILIKTQIIHYTDKEPDERCYPIDGMVKFAQSLIDTGKFVEAEKWIKVNDRLPNDQLKHVAYSEITARYKLAWYNDYHKCWLSNTTKVRNITHWMPLPAAPGESTLSSAGKEVMKPYIRGCRDCADSDGMCDTYPNQYCDPDVHKKEMAKQKRQLKAGVGKEVNENCERAK